MNTMLSVETIRIIAMAKETKEIAKTNPKYFTRERSMPFCDLLYFLLNPAKECLQTRLNNFFKRIGKKGMRMSQQAISKARSHFDHSPFEKMARKHVEIEYGGEFPLETWNGYHVFGIDGSTAILPGSPELKKEFGVSGCTSDCASAGISILCDVLHDWIVDASINEYPQNERAIAKEHIRFLQTHMARLEKKIILFDRGYPSLEMLEYLNGEDMNYLMRCQRSWLAEITGAPMGDSICTLKNGQKVRVYKFILASGEEETLVTNLFDISASELPELYFLRWGVEGKYDVLKNKIELENFSGYTKNSILQDFWVSITLSIVVAIAKKEADEKIQKRTEGKNNRRKQSPNVSQLVASLKDDFVLACRLPSDDLRNSAIILIIHEISLAVTTHRPDRPHHNRVKHPKKKQYPINRKSNI